MFNGTAAVRDPVKRVEAFLTHDGEAAWFCFSFHSVYQRRKNSTVFIHKKFCKMCSLLITNKELLINSVGQ